ncbi:hypothetical protein PRV_00210 [Mycoplasma parvum str. Indiana]|uniref:Uncharacterized protein n=1 Tax=Mycoplasma parvum str. Indiana TaxID=1403316 RepID=U5NBQ3_9MOLU|nr:hypothetical protein PRV_00210 [Mycoplasma parvum str. Indiana]
MFAEGFIKNLENSNIVIENVGKLNIELCKVEVDMK